MNFDKSNKSINNVRVKLVTQYLHVVCIVMILGGRQHE